MTHRAVLLLFSVALLPASAGAWENKETHPALTDAAVSHAESLGRVLRDAYGLSEGLDTKLAPQKGFASAVGLEEVDRDLGEGILRQARFNLDRSVAAWWPYPFGLAPEDVRIGIAARCESPIGSSAFEACFEGVKAERNDIRNLLRSGVFAEDNPNIRASNHFHDPVKPHGHPLTFFFSAPTVPTDNRGLDNTSDNHVGQFARELVVSPVTRVLRGGGDFRLVGVSAQKRALGHPTETAFEPANFYALADAERYLYRALTAPQPDEREHWMAIHFLAVGSVVHLLEDMGSVAHTRNDFLADHLLPGLLPDVFVGASLEDAGAKEELTTFIQTQLQPAGADLTLSRPARELIALAASRFSGAYLETIPLVDPLASPTDPGGRPAFDAGDFWDREAEPEDANRYGLAQLTNRYFFSRATIDDRLNPGGPPPETSYPFPPVPSCQPPGGPAGAYVPAGSTFDEKGTGSDRVFLTTLPERRLRSGSFYNLSQEQPFLSSALVPHLARCRFHAKPKQGATVPREGRWVATVIDDSVHRDYLELLFPLTIDYTAKFLDFYFAPRIQVVRLEDHPELNPPEVNRFTLANRTGLPFDFQSDAVEIVYDDLEGQRRRIGADCGPATAVELAPAPDPEHPGPESDLVCAMPSELLEGQEAANRASFWVVVRGQLGGRGSVVPLDATDDEWTSKDFVVAFERIGGDDILFDSANDASTDADRQWDIYSFTLDHSRLNVPATESEISNLTQPLRAALGDPQLDFFHPVPSPDGRKLAIRSDYGLTQGQTPASVEPSTAFLFDSEAPPGPAALEAVQICGFEGAPCFKPLMARVGNGFSLWPRNLSWSLDGQALFIHLNQNANDLIHYFDEALLYRLDANLGNPRRIHFHDEAGSLPGPGEERISCHSNQAANRAVAALTPSSILTPQDCTQYRNIADEITAVRAGDDIALQNLVTDSPSTLVNDYVARFDMASAQVVGCVGVSCGSLGEALNETSPILSPDGTKLAFVGDVTQGDIGLLGRGRSLYIADGLVPGSPIRKVVDLVDGKLYGPSWSPGGEWIAFAIDPPNGIAGDIFVVRTDQQGLQTPIRATMGQSVETISWRPTKHKLLLPAAAAP